MPREDVKWVGLDVAKDAIAVRVLDGSSEGRPREPQFEERGEERSRSSSLNSIACATTGA
jgi:hypothetical protein